MQRNEMQRLRKWETAINALLIAAALLTLMKLI
jgi:hypothetical protein